MTVVLNHFQHTYMAFFLKPKSVMRKIQGVTQSNQNPMQLYVGMD
jgi:hypothetical protein